LDARLIRTIGDPDLRMREDPIRMLRAVRFAAKLGFDIEPATRQAMVPHREELKTAAVPRLVEETFRTLAHVESVRAFALMAELGLLEVVLPELAQLVGADGCPVDQTVTVRNLASYARATATAQEPGPPRWVLLAALFLDFHRKRAQSGASDLHALVAALRRGGFAKADTEQMRLALDAFDQLIAPSRRTRRLRRRPYYEDARRFFELMAPNYGAEAAAIAREFAPQPEHHYPQPATPSNDHRTRRRRRRRGRRRSNSTATPSLPSE
ncbi:MAG: hypothetical protein ACREQB_07780, partial [Candidatus Binataceae bacterium]